MFPLNHRKNSCAKINRSGYDVFPFPNFSVFKLLQTKINPRTLCHGDNPTQQKTLLINANVIQNEIGFLNCGVDLAAAVSADRQVGLEVLRILKIPADLIVATDLKGFDSVKIPRNLVFIPDDACDVELVEKLVIEELNFMCYSLIAETCDMLIALDAKIIDIGNCDFDPMICVATILTKGASAARAEA